jgi:hypothetical protein
MANPTIKVRLYDPALTPLKWQGIESVNAKVVDLEQENPPVVDHKEGPKADADPVEFELTPAVGANPKLVGVTIAVTYKSKQVVTCEQIAMFVKPDTECGCPAVVPSAQAVTSTYEISSHWCDKDRKRIRTKKEVPGITRAYADLISRMEAGVPQKPKHGDKTRYDATVHDGVGYLTLPTGSVFHLHAETANRYARCTPELPLQLHVCCEGQQKLDLCMMPCDRVITLKFVDQCGQPVQPRDVFVQGESGQTAVDVNGMVTLKSTNPGARQISSSTHDIWPSEIRVDDRVAQVFVLQTKAKAVRTLIPVSEEEFFILDFEKPPRGEALVEVLTPAGEAVTVLRAESDGKYRFPAQPNQEFCFVAKVNGREVERKLLKS